MRGLKIASIIVTAVGMLMNFYYSFWVIALFGIAAGFGLIAAIVSNKRFVWLGILAMIFASLPGGILYLCWKPTKENT